MVDEHNAYTKKFRQVRDYAEANPQSKFCLRLIRHNGSRSRTDNTPTCDEGAALIIGNDNLIAKRRDIVVKQRSGDFQRLHETHNAFIPLQYPLMFPYGERGYQVEVSPGSMFPLGNSLHSESNRDRLSMVILLRQGDYFNSL